MPISCFIPKSSKNCVAKSSLLAYVLDITTIFCRFEAKDIAVPPRVNTKLVVLLYRTGHNSDKKKLGSTKPNKKLIRLKRIIIPMTLTAFPLLEFQRSHLNICYCL